MTNKLKPDWAGEDLLSKFVNLLIQTKPIYKVMVTAHSNRAVLLRMRLSAIALSAPSVRTNRRRRLDRDRLATRSRHKPA